MNEEKALQKKEAKRIRAINNSLSYLSKNVQQEIGVLAVQREDNVYYCGENIYKKIYIFKPAILNQKRKELIRALCDIFENRIRLSLFLKNNHGKLSAYMFMSVSFEAPSYYEATLLIKEFEDKMRSEISSIINLTVSPCTVEELLTYTHMNCYGELVRIDESAIFSKSTTSIYEKMSVLGSGMFQCSDRYGISLLGKNYPEYFENVTEILTIKEGTYHICVDLQKYKKEDMEVYQYELSNRYNSAICIDEDSLVNMTYVIVALTDSKEKTMELSNSLLKFYDSKKIQLMPVSGREREAFYSCCSLGLLDFRSMQNVRMENIPALFM